MTELTVILWPVVGNYRPPGTLLLLCRLISDKLAGTLYVEHFLASEP